jgi:hypothetical protein
MTGYIICKLRLVTFQKRLQGVDNNRALVLRVAIENQLHLNGLRLIRRVLLRNHVCTLVLGADYKAHERIR